MSNNDNGASLFYKTMIPQDHDFLKSLQSLTDDQIRYEDFIKNKYRLRFFVVDVPLNQDRTSRVILLKQVKGTKYTAKKRWFVLNPYDNAEHVRILENKKEMVISDQFEIAAYFESNNIENSFFFISARKLFEDLFGYHEAYEKALQQVSKKMPFLEWPTTDDTIPVLRSCYSLSKFSKFDECIVTLKSDLTSLEDNKTKRALTAKGISFKTEEGELKINPTGTQQLRAFLKIVKDGIATTHYLGREGITGDFEEINS